MSSNNQSNQIIKWGVIITDFLILNVVMYVFYLLHPKMGEWKMEHVHIFFLVNNLALMVAQARFRTVVHERLVSLADILRRIIMLTATHMVLAYLLLKIINHHFAVGWLLLMMDTLVFLLLIITRSFERMMVKHLRLAGRNIRKVTFVGSDQELLAVYEELMKDMTTGYRVLGYYADEELPEMPDGVVLKHFGTLKDLLDNLNDPQQLHIVDDLFVCMSRKERDTVRRLSNYCDKNVVHFYFVPVSVETLGINLKREMLNDMEVYTTFENPLSNPWNKLLKRLFDIVLSLVFLLCVLPFLPIIALIIKIQSPKGPIFFKQLRTGIDGKNFYCFKFRSMHPNKNEDGSMQATKDDPRKFPFGNFMCKASIDELPQFWNVLKGSMSIVGPRPHPLAINEEYTKIIDKYMVRHFVKPGVTGWAQVTGFRGETKELWQMEGRVKRDIWYMEHWSIWLDIRIIWLTAKTMVVHDKNAY